MCMCVCMYIYNNIYIYIYIYYIAPVRGAADQLDNGEASLGARTLDPGPELPSPDQGCALCSHASRPLAKPTFLKTTALQVSAGCAETESSTPSVASYGGRLSDSA